MKFLTIAKTGKNHGILYVAMIAIVFLAMNLGSFPLTLLLLNAVEKNPQLGSDEVEAFYTNPDFMTLGINPNLGFLFLLLSFVFGFIAFYFIFPKLHKRPFKTLITPNAKIDFQKIIFGFVIWLILGLLIEYIAYLYHPDSFSFNFELNKFIPLLLLSLLILPIQTSLEELIFRSYLFQGIGNSSIKLNPKIKVIAAWIITSLLFGAIHGTNPEVQSFGIIPMMFYYIGAGLFLGILTIWDDGLELALGVHAATNFIGAVMVGYEGAAIQTESLFKTSELNVVHMTVGFYIAAIIFTLICKKKYGWTSFIKEPIKNYNEII